MDRLDDVPVGRLERLAQQRRARELVADQLGPLRGDDEEPDERLVGRDPGVPAEQRLAEHRRPLDLEQEGDLAADVPDAVDLGEVLDGAADPAEVGALLAGSSRSPSSPPLEPPGLLAPADPDAHAEPVAGVGDRRQQLRVLLAAAQEVVAGDRAGRACWPGSR